MISTRRCSCSTARSRSPATAKPKLSAPAIAARCRPERYMRNKSGRRACATSRDDGRLPRPAEPPSRDIYAAIARLYDFLAAAEAEETPGPDNAVKTLNG